MKTHTAELTPYLRQQSFPAARRTSKKHSGRSHQSKSLELLWVTYWCLESTIPTETRYIWASLLHVQITPRYGFSAQTTRPRDTNSAWHKVLTPGMRYMLIQTKKSLHLSDPQLNVSSENILNIKVFQKNYLNV